MKYIPTFAKGTSKSKSSQAVKKATGELITKLNQTKSSKEDKIVQLDKAEAKSHQDVLDLRRTLHKYIDKLADSEDAKITSEFKEKKGEVQMDIASIRDQIDATETISKKLKDCKGDNEPELFIYIKQGEKVVKAAKQKLTTLSKPEMAIPKYNINSTIEKSIRDIKSLGQFQDKPIKTAKEKVRVRHPKDDKICNITGICLLPDASVVIADCYNKSLKKLDPSYKLVGYLDMTDKPFDVCYTDKNEVAVTMPWGDKVQFVSVGGAIKKTWSFETDAGCSGIVYSNNTLFVCISHKNWSGTSNKGGKVCMYSLSGSKLGTIPTDPSENSLFTMPRYITASTCAKKLLVSDGYKRVVITNKEGKLLDTFTDMELRQAEGICMLGKGDWLVADIFANKVFHASRAGGKLGVMLREQDGIEKPQAVCYDCAYSRLLVSAEVNDFMKVYDIAPANQA